MLRQRRFIYDEDGKLNERNLCSKLHFVDLAGSERVLCVILLGLSSYSNLFVV